MRHPRLIVSSILACLLIFAAALVLHQGDGGQSMQGGGVTLEQKSTVAKFNEWWSRIQKVQGDIIKLKNEANKKADEEVHTLSVRIPHTLRNTKPPTPPADRWDGSDVFSVPSAVARAYLHTISTGGQGSGQAALSEMAL